MKIYKNNKVKYWTPFFNDLKSFDILDIRDISLRYNKAFKFIRNIDYDPRLQYGAMKWTTHEDNSSNVVERHFNKFKDQKFIYIELPYQLFEDYFNTWLYRNQGHGPTNTPWSEIEDHINNNKEWGKEIEAFNHDSNIIVREYEDITSYGVWLTFLLYGLGTPVFNNANYFPKRNTHRMAFCYKNKSDVPIFFQLQNDNDKFNLEFVPFSLNPKVSGYDFTKFKADAEIKYTFKDIRKAQVDIENKEVIFYDKDNTNIAKYVI